MAISSSVSSAEVTEQVTQRFVGSYFEACLVNADGIDYVPGVTNDATFMAFEITPGTAGYQRQVISYTSQDVQAYSNGGVFLNPKASVFSHDGGSTANTFTHAVLVWGGGNVVSFGVATAEPSGGFDGVYTNLPTLTTGSGNGLICDLTINNDIFVVSVAQAGTGYQTGDGITIANSDLVSAGAIDVSETSGLSFSIDTVSGSDNPGQIVAVAPLAGSASLTAGNEAAFYWNLKNYGGQ